MLKQSAVYVGTKKFDIQERITADLAPEEVRLDVAYCGICGTDRHAFHGVMDVRIGTDIIIGHEMSGVIAEVGSKVSNFQPGDRVVVRPLNWCGECPTCKRGFTHICENFHFIGYDSEGAFQSSWNVNQRILHKIPDSVSLQDAALVEPLAVAMHDVGRSGATSDDFVLIIGGGPIGVLIALALKDRGIDVVISEINEVRLGIAESLGIKTLNPKAVDMGAEIRKLNQGSLADIVFEVSASAPGALAMSEFARPRGKIVLVGIYGRNPEVSLAQFFEKELTMLGARVYQAEDFEASIELLSKPGFPAAEIISKIYPLQHIEHAFADLDEDLSMMKILVECGKPERSE